jgi:hypothetical protein
MPSSQDHEIVDRRGGVFLRNPVAGGLLRVPRPGSKQFGPRTLRPAPSDEGSRAGRYRLLGHLLDNLGGHFEIGGVPVDRVDLTPVINFTIRSRR